MKPQRLAALLTLAGLALPGAALAADDARTLYVKAKNTHLKKSIEPAADTLVVLQPGEPVTYDGREGGTPWHRVGVQRQSTSYKGFVYQANLSTTPPSMEITSKRPDQRLSPEAFASSGAAVKAIGPGVLAYGEALPRPESARELDKLEKLALGLPTDRVSEYARAGGLPSVVGLDKAVAAKAVTPKSSTKSKKGKTR